MFFNVSTVAYVYRDNNPVQGLIRQRLQALKKTFSCNWPEKLSSRFLGQLISGDDYTTFFPKWRQFLILWRFCTAVMLHGRNNRFFSVWEIKNVISNAKHFHCSCHETWLPYKKPLYSIFRKVVLRKLKSTYNAMPKRSSVNSLLFDSNSEWFSRIDRRVLNAHICGLSFLSSETLWA